MRWVKVEDVGETEFLIDEQVEKVRFQEENERVLQLGLQPAKGRPLLLGITKASLSTDSFISAASFRETTRVLTEASISGKWTTCAGTWGLENGAPKAQAGVSSNILQGFFMVSSRLR